MEETCQESHQMYVKTNHPKGKSGDNITTGKSEVCPYQSNHVLKCCHKCSKDPYYVTDQNHTSKVGKAFDRYYVLYAM